MHTNIHIHTHIHTYTYTHPHVNTYTYTHTHTRTHSSAQFSCRHQLILMDAGMEQGPAKDNWDKAKSCTFTEGSHQPKPPATAWYTALLCTYRPAKSKQRLEHTVLPWSPSAPHCRVRPDRTTVSIGMYLACRSASIPWTHTLQTRVHLTLSCCLILQQHDC